MKFCKVVMMSLFFVLMVGGCNENAETGLDKHLINTELVKSVNNIAIENAIISQHTLFPYHFVKNGAMLNELGERDFSVLMRHFTEHTGVLNIRRNSIQQELYDARVKLIVNKLEKAGVDTERMSISDGMPGGPGMSSEKIVTILEKIKEEPQRQMTTTDRTRMR